LAAAIHDGPKMTAQRRWSEALATSQRVAAEPTRQSGHATVRQPVIQREIDAGKLAKFIEDVVAAIRKEDDPFKDF
jgi:hypothetical protein